MSLNDSKSENIQSHFQALTETASSLNAASDELTKVIASLDEALKKLNVGLMVWVTFITWGTDEPSEYDEEQIGYCKINGKWGISLRRIWGDHREDRHVEDGPWHFSDGPREMRLRGVDKIPELIQALSKQAADTTKKVQEKTEQVRELAAAIEQIARPSKKSFDERAAFEAMQASLKTLDKKMVKTAMEVAKHFSSTDASSKAKQGSK
jgi:methyl-accepting chemotaxis protein